MTQPTGFPENQLNGPVAETSLTIFPAAHRTWRQLLWDHNPCLLLSTVLMLLGCYLINGALNAETGDEAKLFALLGAVNIYEACIIPLGLILIARFQQARGSGSVARDGLWLLLFETLFLVNATFINVDHHVVGWGLNIVLFVLALAKGAVIFRGLGIGLGPKTFGFLALQLAIIYGLPIFLRSNAPDGVVSPSIMYGLWWLVGMLPLAYDVLGRIMGPAGERRRDNPVQAIVRVTYLVAPWILLTAHLGFSHWAFHSDFTVADLTPALLGVAIAWRGAPRESYRGIAARLLPAIAFAVSLAAPEELRWSVAGHGFVPPMFAAAAVGIVYGYLHSPWAAMWCAVAAALVEVLILLRAAIFAFIRAALDGVSALIDHAWLLVPSTAQGWGVFAIIMAFVLLGAGALMSLSRVHRSVERE